MGIVLAKEGNTLRVEFGLGEYLTFQMREEAGTLQAVRLMVQKEKRARLAAGRIETLSEQAQKAKDNAEYQRINKEIEELAGEPDNASVLIDMIYAGAETWTDCYADKAAAAAGQPMEWTKASIEKLPLGYLNTIGLAFMKHYGLTEEAEPGEAKGSLPEPLQQASSVRGSFPTGIVTSATTEP